MFLLKLFILIINDNIIIGGSMNNNRFKVNQNISNNTCSNCGASLPYGSVVCLNCNTPLKLNQIRNSEMDKLSTRKEKNVLIPCLLIISVLLIIITFAILLLR